MNNSTSGQVLRSLRSLLGFGVALCAVVFGAPQAAAQVTSSIITSQDCVESVLKASDDPSLTRQERIAKLDEALLASLNNSDLCQSVGLADGDSAGQEMGGAAGGAVAGAAPGESAGSPVQSVPVGDIQGDAPSDQAAGARNEAQNTDPTQVSTVVKGEQTNQARQTGPQDNVGANGKLPEDIPPAENDDIIAKQFRQAAMDETDPEARAKLWNEYRRYKNLPVQAAPEADAKP